MRGTDTNDEEGSNNDVHSHHDGEEYSDPDQDEVPDDIDDEGAENGENLHPLRSSTRVVGLLYKMTLGQHVDC
ncbi:hypothetical protein GOBAR_AA33050 [Gossypium barbadense]|uniref:Uncharacterized protein n=1 Tax=Gossypium barbadense TaxID=3634 RepID=A0A2P5W961_GOSBA|nr:hypothetical protein GOBAR_AA33050 [Gossypium barbadense]